MIVMVEGAKNHPDQNYGMNLYCCYWDPTFPSRRSRDDHSPSMAVVDVGVIDMMIDCCGGCCAVDYRSKHCSYHFLTNATQAIVVDVEQAFGAFVVVEAIVVVPAVAVDASVVSIAAVGTTSRDAFLPLSTFAPLRLSASRLRLSDSMLG